VDISHRKVTKRIQITDLAGAPAVNVKVRVKQKKHEFLFGCNAFETIPLVAAKDKSWSNAFDAIPIVTDEDRAKYDAIVQSCDMWTDLFNFGTLPFYWGSYEPVEGKVMNKSRHDAAEFLRSRGVAMKGHPLCWHTECAKWLLEYDNKTILKKQLDRIERDVTEFKGVIDMWDVINEVVIMPVFDKYDNAITRLCNEYGRVGLVKMVFDKAKECNPDATLLLNDFNTTPKYEELIAECLDAGVPITAIGIQSHQHQGYWGVDKIYDVLERKANHNRVWCWNCY